MEKTVFKVQLPTDVYNRFALFCLDPSTGRLVPGLRSSIITRLIEAYLKEQGV